MFKSETVSVDREPDGAVSLKIDVPGRAVNVLTHQVLTDLGNALTAVERAGRIPVLVVRSGKASGFLAGADLAEFRAIRDAAEARNISASGQHLFDRLAAVNAPSIAVIHGACLGGGLELALACDYRLVFDKPSTQLGLPEVELGLLPGWGGTQRLPRIVGLERALRIILGGKRLTARDALDWGLADASPSTEATFREEFARLVGRALGAGKRPRTGLPRRTWRQWLLEGNPWGRRLILRGAERIIHNRVPDDMPAPIEALEAVRIGLARGMEAGLTQEREAASRLALSPACRNLISAFFHREAARKLPPHLVAVPQVKRVGVVGAGVMGAGIAQLAALSGCAVIVQEVNQEALAAGLLRMEALFAKAVERKRLTQAQAQGFREAIRGTIAYEGFDTVDLVIEAAVENLELKRNLFRELARRTRPGTILATNTSSIAVARLQEDAEAARVGGLHFFNPVHKMPLVEVVKGPATADATTALLTRFAIDLGKTPVVVGDGPGFVVNRILLPYFDEALRLVAEGVPVPEIDRVMRRFGMPVGPLQLLDQIGLDVAAHVGQSIRQQLGTTSDMLIAFERMREKGWLGEKSGQGFYLHRKQGPYPNRSAQTMLEQLAAPAEQQAKALAQSLPVNVRLAEARERLVLAMVNEAAQVVAGGLADAETTDVAMVFGTGWAPHRGGPLRYADDRGLAEVVQALEGLQARLGPRFTPSAELSLRARQGRRFR